MTEKPNVAVVEDTEETMKWRSLSWSEMDFCWKILAERMEEEVLDKLQVEESKREAFRGGGAPSDWRTVRKNKTYRIRKWGEDCWARIFLLKKYNLQRPQCKQEKSTEEEGMKQQQRMVFLKV